MSAARGVSPKVWGPAGWRMLHGFAALTAAKPERLGTYREIVEALEMLLPCPLCRRNFTTHIQSMGFPADARGLPFWVYKIHHRANGTRSVPGWTEVKKEYVSQWAGAAGAANCNKRWNDIWVFLEAIVETHPGGWYVTRDYTERLGQFFGGVFRFMELDFNLPEDVRMSRKALRMWLSRFKKKVGVTQEGKSGLASATKCNSTSVCSIDARGQI